MDEPVKSFEVLYEVKVSDSETDAGLKEIVLSSDTHYDSIGITSGTHSEMTLEITTKSFFDSQVYEDETLSRVLMNAVTNALLLEHISRSVEKDFGQICSNNDKARTIHDSIKNHIDRLNEDLLDIIVKIG